MYCPIMQCEHCDDDLSDVEGTITGDHRWRKLCACGRFTYSPLVRPRIRAGEQTTDRIYSDDRTAARKRAGMTDEQHKRHSLRLLESALKFGSVHVNGEERVRLLKDDDVRRAIVSLRYLCGELRAWDAAVIDGLSVGRIWSRAGSAW